MLAGSLSLFGKSACEYIATTPLSEAAHVKTGSIRLQDEGSRQRVLASATHTSLCWASKDAKNAAWCRMTAGGERGIVRMASAR